MQKDKAYTTKADKAHSSDIRFNRTPIMNRTRWK